MKNEKHTRGPWYQRRQGSEIEIKAGIYTVCMVHDFSRIYEGKNEANANLIAAAPELFDALQLAISNAEREVEAHNYDADWHNNNAPIGKGGIDYKNKISLPAWIEKAKTAIAKANPKTEKI